MTGTKDLFLKPNAVGGRLGTATLLIICGAVVLGISIHIEHAARTIGFKSHTFTYDAFVGAFTLLFEVVFIILRLTSRHHGFASLAAELGLSLITWVFYLAAGIDTTIFTDEDRSVCRHLDSLLDVPEFHDLDPEVLATIKKIFQDVCSELHAQLAFIWIGFIVCTLQLLMLIFYAVRLRRNGGDWTQVSLASYQGALHTHNDPFVDPVGTLPGPSVGVPRDDEDPDYKP